MKSMKLYSVKQMRVTPCFRHTGICVLCMCVFGILLQSSDVLAAEREVLLGSELGIARVNAHGMRQLRARATELLECISGETILVVLNRPIEHIKDRRLLLLQHDKRILSAPIIEQFGQQFAILGIPPNLETGSYMLALAGVVHGVSFPVYTEARKTILIKKRSFFTENIALNQNLSARRRTPPSAKVREQARNMWDLTGTLFPEDLFAVELFSLPVENYKYFSGMYSDSRRFIDTKGKIINNTLHGGIDIVAQTGTAVYAPAPGRVVYADNRVITGNTVVISHFPGLFSLYYHMSAIDVRENEIVGRGVKLGAIGNTGFSTGPHLHWEIRVNNVRVDPLLNMGVLDKVFLLSVE